MVNPVAVTALLVMFFLHRC